jgi:hypothetical protein
MATAEGNCVALGACDKPVGPYPTIVNGTPIVHAYYSAKCVLPCPAPCCPSCMLLHAHCCFCLLLGARVLLLHSKTAKANVVKETPANKGMCLAIRLLLLLPSRYLGIIAVDLKTGTLLRGPRPQLLGGPNSSAPVPQDAAVQNLVNKYKAPLQELMISVIGAPKRWILFLESAPTNSTCSDFVRATKSSATASICSNQVGRLCPWWAIEPSYGQTKQTLAATCAMPSCVACHPRSPRNIMYQFA